MFEKRVDEETKTVERRETLTAEILGYDVILSKDSTSRRLSIYRNDDHDRLRMGIIECHPRSVGTLEDFALIASELFAAIAQELRAAGEDDMRSDWEKRSDAWEEDMRVIAKWPHGGPSALNQDSEMDDSKGGKLW